MKTIQVLVSGFLVSCLFHAAGATPIRVESSAALAIRGSQTDTSATHNVGLTAEPEDLDEETLSHLLSEAKTATNFDKLPNLGQLNDPIHALDSAARLNELNKLYQEITSTRKEITTLISVVLQRLDAMKEPVASGASSSIHAAITKWKTAQEDFLRRAPYEEPPK